jgi:hypothetical protein
MRALPANRQEEHLKYRMPGRTGIKVSPYCLHAIMFGALGDTGHDDSIRIIQRRWTRASTSSTPTTRWKSRRRLATLRCWRATLTRALARFFDPLALRDSSR